MIAIDNYQVLLNPVPPGLFTYPQPPGGETGVGSDPHAISRTNDLIEPREAAFESSLRDLSKAYLRFLDSSQLLGQGQVNCQVLTFLYDEA